MIDLDFAVLGIEVARHSAVPLLLLKLRVRNRAPALPVENVMLQAQVRIEAAHRGYEPSERTRLSELFGSGPDWDRGLRGLLWANVGLSVPGFQEECEIDLPLPCSHDFNVAATKYFHGLETGEAPLLLLFSGTVFFRDDNGDLQISQIAHHKEASYRLPVQIWRAMMDHHYPDSVWLRVSRGLFEEVCSYKRRYGCTTIEEALHVLLARQAAKVQR